MSTVVPELRSLVMIVIDASWEDQSGSSQTTRARMEDKSTGGACIRVKTPLAVGTRLRIQWRFDQFTGIVKYCRSDSGEYLVGIQRERSPIESSPIPAVLPPKEKPASTPPIAPDVPPRLSPLPIRPVAADVPSPQNVRSAVLPTTVPAMTVAPIVHPPNISPVASTTKSKGPPRRQGTEPSETSERRRKVESAPMLQSATAGPPTPPPKICSEPVRHQVDGGDRGRMSHPQDFDTARQTELHTERIPKEEDADKERNTMGHKWLGLAPWNTKQDDQQDKPDDLSTNSDENSGGKIEKENPLPHQTRPKEKAPVHSAREVPAFQVELLSMEDTYRAAGIMSPRSGYSVNKVIEMLNSAHVRALSKELKRAAVLMALDAAGISIDVVQRDAKARQDALDAYEAEQKKRAEAEWARKAEEVAQIQAELESIKAHYSARISRNVEGVARDKARLSSWIATKQHETQSMAEAIELCLNSLVHEPASPPLNASLAAAASATPARAKA